MRNPINCKAFWKPIPGYEGYYEISTIGEVKSLSRFIGNGNSGFVSKDKILKPSLKKNNGYYSVGLCLNGKSKSREVHQLMAITFLNHVPCGYKLVVDHKNHIRTDNRVENLDIITSRVNTNQKHIKSSSQYVGVYWNKKDKKWKSLIVINGIQKYLGYFNNEEEASDSYINALKNHLSGLPIEVKKPNCSSKYKGVSWYKPYNKWFSYIDINRKRKFLGYFLTEIDAHNAYKNALLEL
jgi:hypothetical protein